MPQWHENLFHFISIISLIRLEINPLIDWSVPNEAQVSWLSFSWELLAPGAGTAHLSFRWTTRAWTWSNRVSVKVCVQHNQFIHLQRLVCNLKLSDECSTRSKCSWIIKAVEPVLEVYWNKKQVNHNTPELPGRRPGDRWRNTVALCRSEEPFFFKETAHRASAAFSFYNRGDQTWPLWMVGLLLSVVWSSFWPRKWFNPKPDCCSPTL